MHPRPQPGKPPVSPSSEPVQGVFVPDTTKIFKYFNGVEDVWGDPLEIYDRLELLLQGHAIQTINEAFIIVEKNKSPSEVANLPQSPEILQQRAMVDAEQRLKRSQARERLIPAVRQAFGLAERNPKTGFGATRDQCLDAIIAYLDFQNQKKMSTGATPTLPTSSESKQPSVAAP